MYTYLPHVKLGVQIIGGLGVSKIVGDIVRNNVPVMTTFQKVTVTTGTFIIGSLVVEQSSRYVERTIDDIVVWVEKRR